MSGEAVAALARWLAALDVHCVVEDGSCRAVVGGVPTRLRPIDGGIAFRTVVCGDDISLDADSVNAANLRMRFMSYAVEDGRLVARFDANTAGACPTFDETERAVHVWCMLVRDLQRLVAELAGTPRPRA